MLLSDGRRTTGVDTLEAAKMAADRGVRIHVVGLGTVDGAAGAADGMAIYMQLDEPTLREVARMTGGEYHHAGTAEELRSVYQDLGSRLQVQTRETEITALLALVGGDPGAGGGGAVDALVRAHQLSARARQRAKNRSIARLMRCAASTPTSPPNVRSEKKRFMSGPMRRSSPRCIAASFASTRRPRGELQLHLAASTVEGARTTSLSFTSRSTRPTALLCLMRSCCARSLIVTARRLGPAPQDQHRLVVLRR